MMVNFLLIVLIIAVAAWISNALLGLEQALSAARARVKASNDTVSKLEDALGRVRHEEEKIIAEMTEMEKEEATAKIRQTEAQRKLSEAQAKKRQKLLIISDRRDAGDKEWIVVVANPQIGEIDGSHPYAQDWSRGREYLVWASGEREASERTLRRFSARPGFVIRSVTPANESVYTTGGGPQGKSGG